VRFLRRGAKPKRAHGDRALVAAITDHIGEHFGDADYMVWHQKVSVYVHVDLHVVPPSDDRPFFTLITSGMSEKPMPAPSEDVAYCELVMALPPDWPMAREDFADERHYWPFRLLQMLAALPHQYETWLWLGHTVPNGDPPAPYAPGTGLCCAMLAPTLMVPEAFEVLRHDGREISFHGVFALHEDEMQAKLDGGLDAVLEPLYQAGVTELVDPSRPSVFA
jgi:hypothetical protein